MPMRMAMGIAALHPSYGLLSQGRRGESQLITIRNKSLLLMNGDCASHRRL
jgi:hypothetical protein